MSDCPILSHEAEEKITENAIFLLNDYKQQFGDNLIETINSENQCQTAGSKSNYLLMKGGEVFTLERVERIVYILIITYIAFSAVSYGPEVDIQKLFSGECAEGWLVNVWRQWGLSPTCELYKHLIEIARTFGGDIIAGANTIKWIGGTMFSIMKVRSIIRDISIRIHGLINLNPYKFVQGITYTEQAPIAQAPIAQAPIAQAPMAQAREREPKKRTLELYLQPLAKRKGGKYSKKSKRRHKTTKRHKKNKTHKKIKNKRY
jgi:hypothetical protein